MTRFLYFSSGCFADVAAGVVLFTNNWRNAACPAGDEGLESKRGSVVRRKNLMWMVSRCSNSLVLLVTIGYCFYLRVDILMLAQENICKTNPCPAKTWSILGLAIQYTSCHAGNHRKYCLELTLKELGCSHCSSLLGSRLQTPLWRT
jgi:hypothetical protein